MDPTRSLYTRQQMSQLTGLEDALLNYWSREGLLIPTQGGAGRGSHRKFDFLQVNIAAIMGQMRRFGLNIGVMRSFAQILQEAAGIGQLVRLHPSDYSAAATLANRLHRFRSGESVMIFKHRRGEAAPPDFRGETLSDWICAKRAANSEKEILADIVDRSSLDSPTADIVAAAEAMGPGKDIAAQIYAELIYDLVDPGFSGSYSWLIGFDGDESWRIEFAPDGGSFFNAGSNTDPEAFGPGIFLPVSGIIRSVWKLKRPLQYIWEGRQKDLEAALAQAGIQALVEPSDGVHDGFTIDAPEDLWETIETLLGDFRFAMTLTDSGWQQGEDQ